MARSNLADILAGKGKTAEAERLYKSALETALAVWGPDHAIPPIIKGKLAAVRKAPPGAPTSQP